MSRTTDRKPMAQLTPARSRGRQEIGSLEYDYLYKIILIGDSGVGKTNLLTRFLKNKFDLETKSTVGIEFVAHTLEYNGKVVKLQLWDTAGQERYRTITRAYYRTSVGVILVYDISARTSFMHVADWLAELRGVNNEAAVFLVGNKLDLETLREVQTNDGCEFSRKNGLDGFFETSALDAINVSQLFTTMLRRVHDAQLARDARQKSKTPTAGAARSPTAESSMPIILPSRHPPRLDDTNDKCC